MTTKNKENKEKAMKKDLTFGATSWGAQREFLTPDVHGYADIAYTLVLNDSLDDTGGYTGRPPQRGYAHHTVSMYVTSNTDKWRPLVLDVGFAHRDGVLGPLAKEHLAKLTEEFADCAKIMNAYGLMPWQPVTEEPNGAKPLETILDWVGAKRNEIPKGVTASWDDAYTFMLDYVTNPIAFDSRADWMREAEKYVKIAQRMEKLLKAPLENQEYV